jgi:mono/diheme cytochrome c family protein
MSKLVLVLPVALFSLAAISAQQAAVVPPKVTPYPDIPADAAKQQNPIKSSPDSIARGQKWFKLDCAMCHDENGDGKGDVAVSMKLTINDFTNPDTFKDHTDGELFYIIKNGHMPMPGEGDRIKTDQVWDIVNYVRSLAKPKAASN